MPFPIDFNLFPRNNPTLPQNDSAFGQRQRQKQLLKAQDKYQWTDQIATVKGVPMATEVHFSDTPTVEWLLLLTKTGLQIVENFLAIKLHNAIAAGNNVQIAEANEQLQQVRQHQQDVSDIDVNNIDHTNSSLITSLIAATENLSFDELLTQFQGITDQYTFPVADVPPSEPLAAYKALFQTLNLPELANTFQRDDTFARLRVAGPNPMLIKGISALPTTFPLTQGQYASVMIGDDLDKALAEQRIYLLDYAELNYLAAQSGSNKYVYAPIALFAIPHGKTSLTPVAIRCGQDHAKNPVFLAVDQTAEPQKWWGWQMAKTVVQVADANYHELFVHLARTHLVLEAFTVATNRCLADCHPVNVLLLPHFEGTLFINNLAAEKLIIKGGPIDHIFGAPIESSQKAAGTDRLNFDFYDNMLPTDLASRNVNNLPDYPYRDDALLVWSAIEKWVSSYIAVYYDNDAAVTGDKELSAWATSLINEGKINGFKAIISRTQLVSVLTMIIYTASAQHAAVNFPQKPYMTYAPALSGAGWQAAPTQQEGQSEEDWLKLLPSVDIAFEQLNVLYLLGSVHYRALGDYRSNSFPYLSWFEDDKITGDGGPLEQFQQALVAVEATINTRNSGRAHRYEFLLPSLIPNSINI